MLHAPTQSLRPPAADNSPSPADYNPSLGQARRQAPAFSLTGRQKADPLKQQQPGPGHYDADKAAAAAKVRQQD